MTNAAANPCRVFGVAAPAAPIVVLLRRGPSSWVQMILWQTDTDTFIDGQWLHGRVYERRCALSPDGQLFVYFAAKRGLRRRNSKTTETWTAVSRPPYFTALALWPKGDTWNGGGVFQDNRTLLLNQPARGKQKQLRRTNPLRVVAGQSIPWFEQGEDEPIYSAILAQQGWQLIQEEYYADAREQWRQQLSIPVQYRPRLNLIATQPGIQQKPQGNGRFLLQQTSYGVDFNQYGGYLVLDWEIIDTASQQRQRIEQAEWADWDPQGRLLFTRQGQVWASWPERYPQEATRLIDLNDRRPDPQPSPPWARKWP